MPSAWDAQADRDLLLAIIDEGSLKSIQWGNVSHRLTAKGYTFTHEACRQHFQKIRKESRGGAASKPSTPRKSPNNSTAKGGNVNLNGNFSSVNYDYNEDDEEDMKTPTKKRKIVKLEDENGQSAAIFKMEEKNANDYSNGSGYIDLDNDERYCA